MARTRQRYVRQMPKIYGNLQPRKRNFSALWRLIPIVLWTAVVGGLGYLLIFSSYFTVKKVLVEGVVFSSEERAKSQITLGQSIWFISKDQIAANVLEDPVVESVSVLKGLPNQVRIVVHEKKSVLRWKSGDTTVVLDQNGLAFLRFYELPAADSPSAVALASIPEVRDGKALPVETGKQISSTSFVSFVTAIHTHMTALLPQVNIDHFEVSDTTYDVTMVSKEGMRVQFNSLGDPGVQARNLTRLVHQNKATLTSQVDLRIDRWGYVQ